MRVPQVLELCTAYPRRSSLNATGNCPQFVSNGVAVFVHAKLSTTPPAEAVTECGGELPRLAALCQDGVRVRLGVLRHALTVTSLC